jgi:uncharacterized protein YeeX (DUF496 family)
MDPALQAVLEQLNKIRAGQELKKDISDTQDKLQGEITKDISAGQEELKKEVTQSPPRAN